MTWKPRKPRLTRRRKLLLWSFCGILAPILYPVWILVRGPVPISVSRETTFLTEPVNDYGYVDYADEVNRLRGLNLPEHVPLDVAALNKLCDKLRDGVLAPQIAPEDEVFARDEILGELRPLLEFLRDNHGVLELEGNSAGHLWADLIAATPNKKAFAAGINDLIGLHQQTGAAAITAIRQSEIAEALELLRIQSEIQRFLFRHAPNLLVLTKVRVYREWELSWLRKLMGTVDLTRDEWQRVLTAITLPDFDAIFHCFRIRRLATLLQFSSIHEGTTRIFPTGTGRIQEMQFSLMERWTISRADWEIIFSHVTNDLDRAEASLFRLYHQESPDERIQRLVEGPSALSNSFSPPTDASMWSVAEATWRIATQNNMTTTILMEELGKLQRLLRHRELLNAAAFVLESDKGRLPKTFAEIEWTEAHRIAKEGPCASAPFRILSVTEENASDGEIVLSIGRDQIQSYLKMTFDGEWKLEFSEVPPVRRTESSAK